jgi:mannose-6-phosphate isomerase-like protein (cupin superfamily)
MNVENSSNGSNGRLPCDHRPWGNYTVLDEGQGYKVKRIEVHCGRRLSYQKHACRAEHWMIVAGTATVTLDGRELVLGCGETVDIPIGTSHRIANYGLETLVFIEIMRGDYLGEDDIIRLEDDFGRAPIADLREQPVVLPQASALPNN